MLPFFMDTGDVFICVRIVCDFYRNDMFVGERNPSRGGRRTKSIFLYNKTLIRFALLYIA